MARVLILGGTRNLGHVTAVRLLREGHDVTVLNRGITQDELPPEIERLHAAREDPAAISLLIRGRTWDAIVDTASYTGDDAARVCELFRGKYERMVFISTGQVYLVRTGIKPPFCEADYSGPVIPEPPSNTRDFAEWRYGVGKRNAEKVLSEESSEGLAMMALRLPMIASERDHYARIQGYIARVQDGGPILIPADGSLPIRHVYVEDVARFIALLCVDSWKGYKALNISYGDSISLADFFEMLGQELGASVNFVRIARDELEAAGLLPGCSPYSGKWMSELDNSLSLRSFPGEAFRYTSPEAYLPGIVDDYERRWRKFGLRIPGYERRGEELDLAKKYG